MQNPVGEVKYSSVKEPSGQPKLRGYFQSKGLRRRALAALILLGVPGVAFVLANFQSKPAPKTVSLPSYHPTLSAQSSPSNSPSVTSNTQANVSNSSADTATSSSNSTSDGSSTSSSSVSVTSQTSQSSSGNSNSSNTSVSINGQPVYVPDNGTYNTTVGSSQVSVSRHASSNGVTTQTDVESSSTQGGSSP